MAPQSELVYGCFQDGFAAATTARSGGDSARTGGVTSAPDFYIFTMASTRVEAFRHASVGWLARIAIFFLSLSTLVLARMGVSIYLLVVAVAVSLLGLYALDSRTRGFGLWAAYFLGFVLFAHLRTLADETGIAIKGHYVLGAERWLFGGSLPTEWLQHRFYRPGSIGALEILCAAIYMSYFIVPHLVALVLWKRNPDSFVRYGLSVLFTVYAGLVVCFAVPTSPPWLAERFAGGPHLSRVLTEAFGHSPEQAGAHSGVAGTNPFAAMPSLHIALTMLVVLALWRHRLLRGLAILYAASMAFALVYTGEHYVIDELAGLATAGVAWTMATGLVRARVRTPRVHPLAVARSPIAERAGGSS